MRQASNSLPLFSALDVDAIETILSRAHEKRRWRDQAIFSEGDPVNEIFLLLSGSVKLTQTGLDGNEVILRLIGRADIVGRVLGREGGQFCTARVLESSTLLLWDVDVFDSLLGQFPAFCRSTMHAVDEQLAEMEQRFWGASTQSIESRLSSELLRLATRLERRNGKAQRIVLSHAELAQLAGTTASTVTRLLREWQSQGVLAIQRGALAVHNLDALARLAERD